MTSSSSSNMDTNNADQPEQLLDKRIHKLEIALEQVTATRKQLQSNTLQVREQIQSGVSRQLEALRSREVWLLQQVEVVRGVKEAVLGQQAEIIQQALGSLQTYAQYQKETDGDGLLDQLCSIDSLDISLQENAAISFRADAVRLRSSIHHWGKVDGRYGPLEGAFVDAELGAASLPQVLEEYEDDEHHVLYKTVQSLKGAAENVIDVKIPKLSERPQDWLLPPSPALVPNRTTEQPTLLFPPFRQRLSEWLNKDNVVSNNSVQQWLTELWNEGKLEEEDEFDVLTSSCAPSVNEEEIESRTSIKSTAQDYFEQVASTPTSTWLLETSLPHMTFPFDVMRYFHEIAVSTKQWLFEYYPIAITKPVRDIEDVDRAFEIRQSVTSYFEEVTNDTSTWLHPRKQEESNHSYNEDKIKAEGRDRVPRLVKELCIANEPCQSFTHCLREENCCLIDNEVTEKWLLHDNSNRIIIKNRECQQKCDNSLNNTTYDLTSLNYLFPPFNCPVFVTSHWLSTTHSSYPFNQSGVFNHIYETSPVDVCAPPVHADDKEFSALFDHVDFSHAKSDINLWLHNSCEGRESMTTSCTLCSYTPPEDETCQLSESKWLHSFNNCPAEVGLAEKLFTGIKQIDSSEVDQWVLINNKEYCGTTAKSDELPELSESECSFQDDKTNEWLFITS